MLPFLPLPAQIFPVAGFALLRGNIPQPYCVNRREASEANAFIATIAALDKQYPSRATHQIIRVRKAGLPARSSIDLAYVQPRAHRRFLCICSYSVVTARPRPITTSGIPRRPAQQ